MEDENKINTNGIINNKGALPFIRMYWENRPFHAHIQWMDPIAYMAEFAVVAGIVVSHISMTNGIIQQLNEIIIRA